jgi:hypothetical protein
MKYGAKIPSVEKNSEEIAFTATKETIIRYLGLPSKCTKQLDPLDIQHETDQGHSPADSLNNLTDQVRRPKVCENMILTYIPQLKLGHKPPF